MPWSSNNPPDAIKNKSKACIEVGVAAANSALERGLSESEAIFAAIAACNNYEKKNQVKKAAKPEVPSHLKALIEVAKQRKQEQLSKPPSEASETSSKQQSINVAFLGKNAIQADPERSLVSVQWDKQGRLIFNFDDGQQIITDPVPVSENIEQYVTISAAAPVNEFELPEEYDHIQFNTESTSEVLPGRLVWNPEEGTLDLGMNGGDVTQHIGLETYYRVKNQTGSTIADGTVVMAVGAVGNSGHILIAPANNNMPPQLTMGVVTHNIPNGENGFVTHFGLVKQIDTRGTAVGETWVDGDILYLHPTLLGRLTKVKPAAPRYHVMIALVVHAHQNGQLFVRPTYGQKLDDIDDVQITNPQHGQVIKYDSTTQTWRNQADNATGDDPEVNSVLTYDSNDAIIRIDYDSGNYKLFSYDLEDNLSRLDYVKGSVIYRKDYVYTNGLLTQVNDSVVGV
jgi:uncharacterized protein YdaT